MRKFATTAMMFFAFASLLKGPGNAANQVWPHPVAGHSVLRAFPYADFPVTRPVTIFQDSKGVFWFGGWHGLYNYNESTNAWTDFTDGLGKIHITGVDQIGEDGKGRIWVRNGPLFSYRAPDFVVFDGGRWVDSTNLVPMSIKLLRGSPLIQGKGGRIWFATAQGLVGFNGRDWNGPFNPPDEHILEYENYQRAHKPRGNAALEQLIEMMSRDLPPQPPRTWGSEVYCGAEDQHGDLWLGSSGVIWRFEVSSGRWTLFTGNGIAGRVRFATCDWRGRVWFSDAFGDLKVFAGGADWTSYGLAKPRGENDWPEMFIEAIYIDREGKVIIGTYPETDRDGHLMIMQYPGNLLLDEQTKRAVPLTADDGKLVHPILAVCEDRQGRIWMGTSDAVLVLKQ